MKIYNGLTPLEAFGGWRVVREVTAEYANERLGESTSKLYNTGYAVLDDEALYTAGGRWYVIENKPMAHCNKS